MKQTKLPIYKKMIRPILIYAAKTTAITKKEEAELRIMESEVMRIILGAIKISETQYRNRMNYEILEELKGQDISGWDMSGGRE